MLFILRWDKDEGWGHLGARTGQGKPVFVGFVHLDDDPPLRALAHRYSIDAGDGMREARFIGCPTDMQLHHET